MGGGKRRAYIFQPKYIKKENHEQLLKMFKEEMNIKQWVTYEGQYGYVSMLLTAAGELFVFGNNQYSIRLPKSSIVGTYIHPHEEYLTYVCRNVSLVYINENGFEIKIQTKFYDEPEYEKYVFDLSKDLPIH